MCVSLTFDIPKRSPPSENNVIHCRRSASQVSVVACAATQTRTGDRRLWCVHLIRIQNNIVNTEYSMQRRDTFEVDGGRQSHSSIDAIL